MVYQLIQHCFFNNALEGHSTLLLLGLCFFVFFLLRGGRKEHLLSFGVPGTVWDALHVFYGM